MKGFIAREGGRMKITLSDIIFQLLLLGLCVGVFPALTIIISYSNYSWVSAITFFVFFMVMSFLVHRYQVKKGIIKETKQYEITFSKDERHIHVKGKGIYTLQDEKQIGSQVKVSKLEVKKDV